MSEDADMARKALKELGEFYDSVQIFACRHESGAMGGTLTYVKGTGNWYSRYGQIVEWMDLQKARAIREDAQRED